LVHNRRRNKGLPGPFVLDKGKPVERPGRKAKGRDGCSSVRKPGCRRNVVALFEGNEAPHAKNQGPVAATQAIAGLQELAPQRHEPDLSCFIGALPVG
jgi:hypothetical protein